MAAGNKKTVITRREFFAYMVPYTAVPLLIWWMLTGRKEIKRARKGKEIVIQAGIPSGISFQQGLILIREGEKIKAFEARCTHLGCSINQSDGKELVCRCHGSRFDMGGNAISGPAIKPLKALKVIEDAVTGNLKIQLR